MARVKAVVAAARPILVIVWHLLADPAPRFCDLGPNYDTNRIDKGRSARNHLRQLRALGFEVTLNPAADNFQARSSAPTRPAIHRHWSPPSAWLRW